MSKDYSKLRGRIVEKYRNNRAFADALGVSPNTICNKLSGKKNITINDINKWSELLDIDIDDVGHYFFAHKVPYMEQKGNE